MSKTQTDQIVMLMHDMTPDGVALEIPPKVMLDMDGEFIARETGSSLSTRFPMKARYGNPMGHMQGGGIVTAIDNTYGPLAFLEAGYCVTTQLNTSYIRPVLANDEYINVKASIIERTKRQLFMEATVTNPAGKTVAVSTASFSVMT